MKTAFALLAACTILCAEVSAAAPRLSRRFDRDREPEAEQDQTTGGEDFGGIGPRLDDEEQWRFATRIASQDSKFLAPKWVNAKMKGVSVGKAPHNKVKVNAGKKLMTDGLSAAKSKTHPSNISVAPPQVLQSVTK